MPTVWATACGFHVTDT